MSDLSLVVTAVTHVLYDRRRWWPGGCEHESHPHQRDRGAISLEQVLWFVAAGVSVAVIAAIMWNQIRDQANTPIDTPSAP
ncbi:hypothetical protein BH23ACT3_BH23ACT3_04040 [soil metagenome]